MDINQGNFYFISDDFFKKINDPFLKQNYSETKRPHFFAFKDEKTNLFWMVPCSSKIEKFEKILENKKKFNKPTDSIKIVTIQKKKTALLFQDMFPVIEKYIESPYIVLKAPFYISNRNTLEDVIVSSKKIKKLINMNIKLTPTSPDVFRIKKIMLEELNNDKKMVPIEKPSIHEKAKMVDHLKNNGIISSEINDLFMNDFSISDFKSACSTLIYNDKLKISENIKNSGFTPNLSLIKKIQKLNVLTDKKNSVSDISKEFKNVRLKKPENFEKKDLLISDIGKIFQSQELEKISQHK